MAQLVQAVQAIAQALQAQFLSRTLVEWAQVALVLLTGATLVVLWKYTSETVRLRKEAQIQNETSLRPILEVVSGGEEGPSELIGETAYLCRNYRVRNLGNGPAFNIQFDPITGDGVTFYLLSKSATLPKDGWDSLMLSDEVKSRSSLAELARATVEKKFVLPIKITIRYRNASGKAYYTTHSLVTGSYPWFFKFSFTESGLDQS